MVVKTIKISKELYMPRRYFPILNEDLHVLVIATKDLLPAQLYARDRNNHECIIGQIVKSVENSGYIRSKYLSALGKRISFQVSQYQM